MILHGFIMFYHSTLGFIDDQWLGFFGEFWRKPWATPRIMQSMGKVMLIFPFNPLEA